MKVTQKSIYMDVVGPEHHPRTPRDDLLVAKQNQSARMLRKKEEFYIYLFFNTLYFIYVLLIPYATEDRFSSLVGFFACMGLPRCVSVPDGHAGVQMGP
jgi:hypothetical protein